MALRFRLVILLLLSVASLSRGPKTIICSENDDPLSVPLKATGATMAPSRGFRMLGAEGQLEFPLLPTDLQVWQRAIESSTRTGNMIGA